MAPDGSTLVVRDISAHFVNLKPIVAEKKNRGEKSKSSRFSHCSGVVRIAAICTRKLRKLPSRGQKFKPKETCTCLAGATKFGLPNVGLAGLLTPSPNFRGTEPKKFAAP